jgi:hypothetical protein
VISFATMQKTGTDDLPVEGNKCAYKPAYKKLTKTAYSDKNNLSLLGTQDGQSESIDPQLNSQDNSLPIVELDDEMHELSRTDTSEQEGFEPPLPVRIKRFSKPSPSAARPLLQNFPAGQAPPYNLYSYTIGGTFLPVNRK